MLTHVKRWPTRDLPQTTRAAIELRGSKSFILPRVVVLLLKMCTDHPDYGGAPCPSSVNSGELRTCDVSSHRECLGEAVCPLLRDYQGAVRNYAHRDGDKWTRLPCRVKKPH